MQPVRVIDLLTPLNLRAAFWFPIQSPLARRELLLGSLILCIPIIGWILNMGHRIAMTHRMQHSQPAWPAWNNYPALFRHGCITLLGMVQYHAPSAFCGYLALRYDSSALHVLAILLWLLATIAVPGYMSHYCRNFEPKEIFNPCLALRRVCQGGSAYWQAWFITLLALLLSFLGLLFFGVGFLVTSVWFWQVAGFSFATVFSQTFALTVSPRPETQPFR